MARRKRIPAGMVEVLVNGEQTFVNELVWWSQRSPLFGATTASVIKAGSGSIIATPGEDAPVAAPHASSRGQKKALSE
jgi:hypothetical protein